VDKRAKYIDFVDIYAALTDNERRRYRQEYAEESEAMAGIVQRAREEGMEQGMEQGIQRGMEQGMEQGIQRGMEQGIQRGIEQGMQQGRLEGERAVLGRLLQRRFGPLSAELRERLDRASSAELEMWAERVLDADSLQDVFR
jgi:flagellar biosynthesis/type III secretory pathway protein FliH